MDWCLSYTNPIFSVSSTLPSEGRRRSITLGPIVHRRPLIVVASSSGGSSSSSTRRFQFSGLSAPLEPSTPAGEFLSGVLLNDCDSFQVTARKELECLAAQRDLAVARLQLSLGSDEACLHRRIAELRTHECQLAVKDVMYMLIIHKFSEMRVHLIPTLSKCIYNGRLEILPSKNWELESIYSFEVLEMVRDHVYVVTGLKANSSVTESWATTEIQRPRLCTMYAASILFGYFLKSASMRYRLEWGGSSSKVPVLGMYPLGILKNTKFGCESSPRVLSVDQLSKKEGNLRGYVMGFDAEVVQMCAKPKSKEAVDLIERHCCALFGDDKSGEVIRTSFASLKRFVLEAVAFGYFLWEMESCANDVYTLKEN